MSSLTYDGFRHHEVAGRTHRVLRFTSTDDERLLSLTIRGDSTVCLGVASTNGAWAEHQIATFSTYPALRDGEVTLWAEVHYPSGGACLFLLTRRGGVEVPENHLGDERLDVVYRDAAEWLAEFDRRKADGHVLWSQDDPIRRQVGYFDSTTEEWVVVSLTRLQEGLSENKALRARLGPHVRTPSARAAFFGAPPADEAGR